MSAAVNVAVNDVMNTASRNAAKTLTFPGIIDPAVNNPVPLWSLSIVSHGHLVSVRRLLRDLARFYAPGRFEVMVTINDQDPDPLDDVADLWPGPLTVIRNPYPKGFSANHNSAIRRCKGRLIAILDSDLGFDLDPFTTLEKRLLAPGVPTIASATIVNTAGEVEDNARELLTPAALMRRYLLAHRYRDRNCDTREVDWIAGLFMATRRENFATLGGFDERYFLYCEDADLCMRAWNRGFRVLALRTEPVVHEARRMSVRRPRYFAWHLSSLVKHWTSAAFWTYLRSSERDAAVRGD